MEHKIAQPDREVLVNIYNADEIGLFYNLQPDKTFCFRNEKCYGGKKGKMRFTVLFAVNSNRTDKFKPFVIVRLEN